MGPSMSPENLSVLDLVGSKPGTLDYVYTTVLLSI